MTKLSIILKVAAVIVAIEALSMFAATGTYIYGIATNESRSLPAMITLLAICLLVAVWLTFTTKGLLQNQRWSRSSAVFWQTCQLAVAAASFTGPTPNALYGVALIIPSVICLVLLFMKPVLQDAKHQLELK
ncbi:MAG: hypothetical protein ACKOWE_05520 [Micrococcales bacterium]